MQLGSAQLRLSPPLPTAGGRRPTSQGFAAARTPRALTTGIHSESCHSGLICGEVSPVPVHCKAVPRQHREAPTQLGTLARGPQAQLRLSLSRAPGPGPALPSRPGPMGFAQRSVSGPLSALPASSRNVPPASVSHVNVPPGGPPVGGRCLNGKRRAAGQCGGCR